MRTHLAAGQSFSPASMRAEQQIARRPPALMGAFVVGIVPAIGVHLMHLATPVDEAELGRLHGSYRDTARIGLPRSRTTLDR